LLEAVGYFDSIVAARAHYINGAGYLNGKVGVGYYKVNLVVCFEDKKGSQFEGLWHPAQCFVASGMEI